MKTLFEKVKPEVLSEIEAAKEKYPHTIKELEGALKGIEHLGDLQLRHVIELESFYHLAFGKFPFSFWDMVLDEHRLSYQSKN